MIPAEPIRVLVADSFPLIREGLKHLIQQHPEYHLIGEVASVDEIYTACQQYRPHVIVVNGHLPVVEIVSILHRQGLECSVVMVSLHLGEETVYRCLQAGVSGVVSLTSPVDSIWEAIQTVLRGQKYLPNEVSRNLALRLSKPSLTVREQEVLAAIAEGKSNQEIGRNLFISEGTVKSHVNRILNKLQAKDRTQALLVALRSGLVSDRMLYG